MAFLLCFPQTFLLTVSVPLSSEELGLHSGLVADLLLGRFACYRRNGVRSGRTSGGGGSRGGGGTGCGGGGGHVDVGDVDGVGGGVAVAVQLGPG